MTHALNIVGAEFVVNAMSMYVSFAFITGACVASYTSPSSVNTFSSTPCALHCFISGTNLMYEFFQLLRYDTRSCFSSPTIAFAAEYSSE